ncbi:MAG: hypothetical protein NTV51_28145 [Verrucomicrobia bacterium]|nr:hypothetical protein [Verrucomicrobiota bacterium]
MRRRLSLLVTLTAWLLATGSQWDVVQTFAWARMFAENCRTLPLHVALKRTFSPEGRCELCGLVSTAKQERQNSADAPTDAPGSAPAGKFSGKVLLAFEPAHAPLLVRLSLPARWSPSDPTFASTERAEPPLPPPRA